MILESLARGAVISRTRGSVLLVAGGTVGGGLPLFSAPLFTFSLTFPVPFSLPLAVAVPARVSDLLPGGAFVDALPGWAFLNALPAAAGLTLGAVALVVVTAGRRGRGIRQSNYKVQSFVHENKAFFSMDQVRSLTPPCRGPSPCPSRGRDRSHARGCRDRKS